MTMFGRRKSTSEDVPIAPLGGDKVGKLILPGQDPELRAGVGFGVCPDGHFFTFTTGKGSCPVDGWHL